MSRSSAGRPRRVYVSVVAALALIAMLPTAASADDFAPEITSFSRTSAELLGSDGVVIIDFTARDEGPAGLTYALFTYRTPLDAFIRVDSPHMGRAAEGSFQATKAIGVWAASGDYVLEKVEIYDEEGNLTTYLRTDSAQFDWAAADFQVDNPLEDVTTPTVTHAELFQDHVAQGTPVVAIYTAGDDLSGVESVTVSAWSPNRHDINLTSLPGLGAAGPATWIVPLAAPVGLYDGFQIIVTDRAGNSLLYRPDALYPYPPRATIPEHSHPDPDTLDFTIEGMEGDRTPPELTSLSMLTGRTRHLGEQVALDYTATDVGTGVRAVAAQWSDGRGHALDASKQCGDPAKGPMTTHIEDFRTLDTDWKLEFVTVADFMRNQTSYRRDGTVLYNGDPGPPTHSFDLSVGDFRLEAGEAAPDQFENTPFMCPVTGDVSLDVPDPDVVVGEPVEAVGEVSLGDDPLPDPVVALHEYVQGEPHLVSVVEGDSSGTYAAEFRPTANASLRATFLGADGPFQSDAARSTGVEIVVRPRVTATFDRLKIRLGQSAALSGSVTPAGEGDRVLLQKRTSRGWRGVGEASIAGDGTFSFTVRPRRAGDFRYRVVKPADDFLAVGRSAPLFLKVRQG